MDNVVPPTSETVFFCRANIGLSSDNTRLCRYYAARPFVDSKNVSGGSVENPFVERVCVGTRRRLSKSFVPPRCYFSVSGSILLHSYVFRTRTVGSGSIPTKIRS